MKIKNKILLVVNPISGGLNKRTMLVTVKAEIKKRGLQLELYETTGKKDKKKIKRMIEDFQPDHILVVGGDGTIQLVAEVLDGHKISVGILPAGSANGLAVNLKLPPKLQDQLKIALGDNILEMDVLKINGRTCLHIADLGINAELIKNYEHASIRGKLGYFLKSIPTLFHSNFPFNFEIEIDHMTVYKKGILLAIANANKFGTGANVNPTGKMNDGKFEILVFKKLNFIKIFKTLSENAKLGSDFVEIISTTQAKIRCTTPVAFQIDGEYVGEVCEVEAQISPNKLLIAVPSPIE
ncbi:diacylglycerol kinase [Gillisia sp. M10.2A]|uniref:Diacylglycerol kinase n=1 Tax=Gillisia lutea TaxID=2909668 RepID=A0ABS9EIY1_9FLAO|nr:diacylglycerol kinase family protein [Gillisia lutea]MCF4101819.1 diacylglycerol kinase [Gillisia lutea]